MRRKSAATPGSSSRRHGLGDERRLLPPHLFLIVWRSKRYLEISLSGYDCIERFSFRVCLPLGTKTGYNVKVRGGLSSCS